MANGTIVNDTVAITTATKIALYSILLFWSLLGNILVIAVVLTYKRLKTNFNYLVVNMAVSDLLVPLLNLPYLIYETQHPSWLISGDFGIAICKLLHVLLNISPFVSSFSLVIIAIERLVLVVYPMLKNALFSGKKICYLIAFTWIAAVVFLCPYFYLFGVINEDGNLKCTVIDNTAYDPYAIFGFFAVFAIPLVAIIVIYTIMLHNLMKASKNVAKIINNEQMLSRQRRNKKIFYMSISIIVAFVIFWGPFFILLFIVSALPKSALTPLFRESHTFDVALFVCSFLGYANAAVNPCLYFIFLGSYREGARRIFRKKSESSEEEAQLEMTRVKSTSLSAKKDNRSLAEGDSLIK